jgi:hypothetical protein
MRAAVFQAPGRPLEIRAGSIGLAVGLWARFFGAALVVEPRA